MVSELFVLYCAQSNFHKLHVKLIVKLGLPILHFVGPLEAKICGFYYSFNNTGFNNARNHHVQKYLADQLTSNQPKSICKLDADYKSVRKYLTCSLLSCREATKAERVLGNGAFEEQSALVNINGGRCIFVRITQILIHFNTNTEANTTTNTLAHVAGEQSGAVKIIGAASLSRQCTPFTWICEQVFQLSAPGTNLLRQIL